MTEAAVGFHCPECVRDGRRTQRAPRTAFGASRTGAAGTMTRLLIGLNVLGLVMGAIVVGLPAVVGNGLFTGVTRWQMLFGEFGPTYTIGSEFVPPGTQVGEQYVGIDDGAVYRLITGTFLHFGILHLLLNMWALWVLGRSLERDLGPARFLALYLVSGLGGSVAAYVFSPEAISAGASGAIFGLFAAQLIVMKRLGRDTSAVLPVLLINLWMTFAISGISIAGHLGGLVIGGLVALGLAYAPRSARTPVQIATIAGATLLLAAITLTTMLG